MIRTAIMDDFSEILNIYASARAFMARNGNPTQWGNDRPSRDLLLQHIQDSKLFVLTDSEKPDVLCGCFYFAIEEEPTYAQIEDGNWISDQPYGVIHLVASNGQSHGFFQRVLAFCEEQSPHLRIDTHHDNKIMQHVLAKNGFHRCGIIHLADGSPLIAYEKC